MDTNKDGVDSPNRYEAYHKQEYTARASVLGKRKREILEDGEADFFAPKKSGMYGVQQNAQPEQQGQSTQINDDAEEQGAHEMDISGTEKKDESVSKL